MGRLKAIVEHPRFDQAIMALIVVNAVILGLETEPRAAAALGPWLGLADRVILGVFVAEIGLRMATGFTAFWRDPWRIFDVVVVAIALVPATGAFAALRAFRILRVLRLVSTVPAMRRVVAGLLEALPGMYAIVLLLALIFYVTSVIATNLFGAAFPEWFGSIGASAYTLFQVMTLESWSMGIVRPVMEQFPLAWLLFVPFIIFTAFAVLNLFIGVIVDAMQSEASEAARDDRAEMIRENEAILRELKRLNDEVAALRAQLGADPAPGQKT